MPFLVENVVRVLCHGFVPMLVIKSSYFIDHLLTLHHYFPKDPSFPRLLSLITSLLLKYDYPYLKHGCPYEKRPLKHRNKAVLGTTSTRERTLSECLVHLMNSRDVATPFTSCGCGWSLFPVSFHSPCSLVSMTGERPCNLRESLRILLGWPCCCNWKGSVWRAVRQRVARDKGSSRDLEKGREVNPGLWILSVALNNWATTGEDKGVASRHWLLHACK